MNLTKLCVAGMCLTALTASAGMIKSNAFETADVGTDWTFDGAKGWDTIGVRVTNDTVNARGDYSGVRPYASAANEKVLKLDTEGKVWTNTVEESFADVPVYVDMLVKFVPSESLPEVDNLVKLALAITNDVLAVTRYNAGQNEWFITTTTINTSLWYRVTVKLEFLDPERKANVKINGTDVTVGGETVFRITDNEGYAILKSIGFQGTGFIDEVVVTKDNPISTGTTLILSFTSGIESVFVGETQKTSGQTVLSGDTLVIKAALWKEITDVTGPATVTWVSGGPLASAATVTVANATSTTVLIADQTETSTAAIGGGTSFVNEESNKVATWALANGVTTLSNGIYDQYLFNIPTNSMPSLFITSIAVSNSTVTVEVQTTNNVDLVTGINGTLQIKAYPVLGGTPELFYGAFSGTTNVTVFTQDIGTNKFVKAAVE